LNDDSLSDRRRQTLKERFRQETSREILAAAEAVFVEDGLQTAAMAKIAERAGVAVGTLYNRFKDREALLQAVLLARRAELLDRVDRSLAELEPRPFKEQLTGMLFTLCQHFEEHRAFLLLAFTYEFDVSSKREMMTALLERMELLLKRGQRDRVLRKDPERLFALTLIAATRGLLMRDAVGLPELKPAQAATMIVELFMKGAGR
jgi:AcrR family transcriptional regulator